MSNGPSNIRINPFVGSGGATTYVNLTETHIIPSVSPFVIRLNEVPEKRDPSNMKCLYVDDTTGAVTPRALTEVAATPAAGQFRPDYSTKADKDDSWNTGLIEFNSADAGKIVQITYTGMGTLAAVQSNKYPSWYTDRGDGSDGDFIPSENTTISGVKNYKNVFIKEGVIIKVDRMCRILCQGTFVNNGIITANGFNSGDDEIEESPDVRDGTLGGGRGGAGGSSKEGAGQAGGKIRKEPLDMLIPYIGVGADGGTSTGSYKRSTGGGAIFIAANSIVNNNAITANGGIGQDGATGFGAYAGGDGGGGGGTVTLIAITILNKGTVTVSGGAGGKAGKYPAGAKGDDGTVTIKQLGVL